MAKDTSLTIRLPAATRRRIEQFAKGESRSLSQAAERLLELGLEAARGGGLVIGERPATWQARPSPLEGALAGGIVPTLDDFRAVRRELSASLEKRVRNDAKPRR